MMNRYRSTERWRKLRRGVYESRCGKYRAEHIGNRWSLLRFHPEGWVWDSAHLALADCQEIAAKMEGGGTPQIVWWGFAEGAKKAGSL